MKAALSTLTLAAVVALSAGSLHARSNEGGIRGDIVNEDAVRAHYAAFTAAWNRHDPDALVSMWTIDGDHVEPDGREANGREELAALLKAQHSTVFKETTLSLSIDDVYFLGSEVALVDGTYAISGIVAPDGTAIPPRKGYLTAILIDERGEWKIVASRLMIPTTLPYKPESSS